MPEIDTGLVTILPKAVDSLISQRYVWTDQSVGMLVQAIEMVVLTSHFGTYLRTLRQSYIHSISKPFNLSSHRDRRRKIRPHF